MKKLLFISLAFIGVDFLAGAQSAYIPYKTDYYHLINRYEIIQGELNEQFHTGFKPYRRDQVAGFVGQLTEQPSGWGQVDRFNLEYLKNDNWEFSEDNTAMSRKPFLKKLYRKPSDFYHYRDKVMDVHINPVIYLRGGIESGADEQNFRNTRGVAIRGSVDRKVGFYTFLSTNEVIFPSWITEYIKHNGAVPGEGFWKPYGKNGYGYFSATGHISFPISKHISAQLGHDRNFIGEGYRSMILSDFSNSYMFFKLNTKIWKFNLTNMWAQLNADVILDGIGRPTDGDYPQKWFSHHRLGINLGKRFNLGVFESVMASDFDWNYMNPVIFYRWVEHQLGTPDKVMLGTDFKWNMGRAMQLYGQFALDEFVFGEFFGINGENSRRNKHGLQLGYKYINAFQVSNLDVQLEYNQARPYTYQEKFEHQSYTHYRTPLTHPRGANFREFVGIVRYQPIPRLFIKGTGVYHKYGADPDDETNMGGDVLKNRLENIGGLGLFGHEIGQGVSNEVALGTLDLSYMLRHNLFLEAAHTFRRRTAENLDAPEAAHFTRLAIRLNIGREEFNY